MIDPTAYTIHATKKDLMGFKTAKIRKDQLPIKNPTKYMVITFFTIIFPINSMCVVIPVFHYSEMQQEELI